MNTAVVAMMLVTNSKVEYNYVPFISSMCWTLVILLIRVMNITFS